MDGEGYQWNPQIPSSPFLLQSIQEQLGYLSLSDSHHQPIDNSYDSWITNPVWASGSGLGPVYPSQAAVHEYPDFDLGRHRINSAVRGQLPGSYIHRTAGLIAGSITGSGSVPSTLSGFPARDYPSEIMSTQVPCSNMFNNNNHNEYAMMYLANRLRNGFRLGNENFDINNRVRRSDYNNNIHRRDDSNVGSLYNNNSIKNGNNSIPIMVTLEDLRGNIGLFAKDQNCHHILQRKMEEGQREVIELMISEVLEDVREIMMNQFGNHFFQKLLDYCDDRDITEILSVVMASEHHFLVICLDSYGTRAVQKLQKRLDRNNSDQKSFVVPVLRRVAVALTKNTNGSHVILEFLKAYRGANDVISPLLEEIANHCVDIAMDKSGCCVLQQCLQDAQANTMVRLLEPIISHAFQLSEHPYGNYVVQYVLGMKIDTVITKIIKMLEGNFVYLSKNKFASNVVEKCLREAQDEEVKHIINEILEYKNLVEILQDKYGNFVVQTAVRRSKVLRGSNHPRSVYHRLSCSIQSHYPFLHSHPYGNKVLSCIKSYKTRV